MINRGADRRDSPDVAMERKPEVAGRSGRRRRHLSERLVAASQRLRQHRQTKTSAYRAEECGHIIGPKCKFTTAADCSQTLLLRQMIAALVVPQKVPVLCQAWRDEMGDQGPGPADPYRALGRASDILGKSFHIADRDLDPRRQIAMRWPDGVRP